MRAGVKRASAIHQGAPNLGVAYGQGHHERGLHILCHARSAILQDEGDVGFRDGNAMVERRGEHRPDVIEHVLILGLDDRRLAAPQLLHAALLFQASLGTKLTLHVYLLTGVLADSQ